MLKNAKVNLIAGILIMAFLLGAPYWVNQGLLFLVGLALIEALFALSWNLMFSYAGLASFGHAAFYGIGAYTVAAFPFHGIKIPFLLVLLIAVVLGAVSSFLVAIVVLRRASGIQLAVLTLALSQLLVLCIGYTNFLGRDDGLSGLRPPNIEFGLFNVDMASRVAAYYFILVVCTAAGGGRRAVVARQRPAWPRAASRANRSGTGGFRRYRCLARTGIRLHDCRCGCCPGGWPGGSVGANRRTR